MIFARFLIIQQVHIQPMVTIASSTTSRPTSIPKPIDSVFPDAGHLQLLICCVVTIVSVALVWIKVISVFFGSVVLGSSLLLVVLVGTQHTFSILIFEYLRVLSSLMGVQVTVSFPPIVQDRFLMYLLDHSSRYIRLTLLDLHTFLLVFRSTSRFEYK